MEILVFFGLIFLGFLAAVGSYKKKKYEYRDNFYNPDYLQQQQQNQQREKEVPPLWNFTPLFNLKMRMGYNKFGKNITKGQFIESSKYMYDMDIQKVRQYYDSIGGQKLFQKGKAFGFRCPSLDCDQMIHLEYPWHCPRHSCRHVNNGKTHSFFGGCQKCGYAPYAYQCYECGFVFHLQPETENDFLKLQKFSYRENMYQVPKYPVLKPVSVPAPVVEPLKPVEEPPFIPHGIPLDERFKHLLIIADTGWGKTWLLKTIAYHDIKAHSSVIIIDSEGGFIKDILRLRDKGEVIYIDFTDPENVPCLSLFDVELGSTPQERERILKGTVSLYLYVFSSLLGMQVTGNQEAMIKFLSELMIQIKGSTLQTLKDVLFDIRPFQREINQLRKEARDFFRDDWPTKEVGEVKKQLRNRINAILADTVLARIFTQSKSKIDLFKAINSGKIILVNTNKSHLQDAAPILGRVFIAMVMQAALRRKEEDIDRYRAVFLFVDEAWRYFDATLQELYETIRKRKLGLVIATQQIQHFTNVSKALRNAAFQSAIKFAGVITADEEREMMKELGLDPHLSTKNTLVQEKQGSNLLASEFYCHVRGQPAKKVKISFAEVQNAPRLGKEEIQDILEENNKRYCERLRVRGGRAEPADSDETVLEPDEHGVLRPRGLPGADRRDEFWQ
jgi:hypothetical protein